MPTLTCPPMPAESTTRIRRLTRATCVELLHEKTVGRVAIRCDGATHVAPVNYAVVDGTITFLCGTGSKLAAAGRGLPMTFEVDDIDERTGTGWSVVVSGCSRVVDDVDILSLIATRRLRPFDPDGTLAVIELDTLLLSGREIVDPSLGR